MRTTVFRSLLPVGNSTSNGSLTLYPRAEQDVLTPSPYFTFAYEYFLTTMTDGVSQPVSESDWIRDGDAIDKVFIHGLGAGITVFISAIFCNG